MTSVTAANGIDCGKWEWAVVLTTILALLAAIWGGWWLMSSGWPSASPQDQATGRALTWILVMPLLCLLANLAGKLKRRKPRTSALEVYAIVIAIGFFLGSVGGPCLALLHAIMS